MIHIIMNKFNRDLVKDKIFIFILFKHIYKNLDLNNQ